MLSPSTPDPRTPSTRRTGLWWRGTRWVAILVLMALSLAVVAWLTLHWGILPRIEQWRPQIEQRVGAALGQTVRIGAIRVHSSGWVPAFELNDVRLLDRAGRPALALGQVRVALAPQSLLAFELRLAQLHVEGVHLDVRRDDQGRIRVAGMDMQAEAAPDDEGAAADWLFSQYEIVVRRGVVRWTDELRQAPPLELHDVDLVLRNGLRRHDLRLDATPPPAWGERFSLRGRFTQSLLARSGDWRRWSGTLYAELPAADMAELRRHVELPIDLQDGRGALRAWLELRGGQWREATADVALADVALRMGAELEPLVLSQLQVRLRGERDAERIALSAEQLSFTTGDGVVWPAGDLAIEWQQAQDLRPPPARASAPAPAASAAPVTGGRLRANRLDLALMASIAERLPLAPAAAQALADLAPAGIATALDLSWSGPFADPVRYRAEGRVSRLALAPRPGVLPDALGRPGLSGADIEFEASESGGRAKLAMSGGALVFPGVFEQPSIAFDTLTARLDWHVRAQPAGPPAIELKVADARFANADAQGEVQATWRTGKAPGFGPGAHLPGEIDLSGRLVRARAERVAAYLPLGIPQPVRRYVERSVRSGAVEAASFTVKGDAWQFPFAGLREGTFRVAARLRDLRFDYLPSVPAGSDEEAWESPWPGFGALQGELVFDRSSMQLSGVQAQLWGLQLRNVQARIADLGAEQPLLQVDGEVRGPAADLLRFVEVSPVGRWIGGGLGELTASGAADLRLGLAIPLADSAQTSVRGSVLLPGNDVRIRPGTPLLAGARGRVDFTQRGFTIVGANARALGGEVSFDGGTQPDGTLRFSGQGTASAEGLRRAAELDPLPAVASQLRGQASYRLNLGFVQGWPEISVTSDLVGLESEWPAPLAKPAAAAWPLRWQTVLLPASLRAGETPRDQLRLDLGNVLQARLARDLSGPAPRITGGAIGVLESAPAAPASGVQARLNLARLDTDAWMRAWQRLPAGAGDAALPPTQLLLRADQLVAGERRLDAVKLDLQHDPQSAELPWRGSIEAEQLAGRITWRAPANPADAGRLSARLSRLALPPSETVDIEPLLDRAPARMPALDVVIDEFELRGRKLGRLEVQAVSRPSAARAGAREWHMDKLELAVPEARLSASGTWAPALVVGAPRRMSLDFDVELVDSGKLAARFGWDHAIRGGKGRLGGKLGWDGSPLAPDLASMEGQVRLALESGQFLRAEPGGIGRLLGILSLQSLPRRLLLDFRDVVQEGFAFDAVDGDVAVSRGRATTSNLRMRGVQAVVLMEGSADLIRETQDLHVLIVPEINAGAASLAYAAINPAVALGTFLAQMVLREPLRAAGTREFRITGPMNEPRVERIERTPGSGASAASAAATGGGTIGSAPAASAPAPAEPRRESRSQEPPA